MEIYAQYQELEKQITILEEQKKVLRNAIEAVLPDEGVKNEFVTASWRTLKKISYPEDVKTLESNVNEAIKPLQEEYQSKIKPLTESVEIAKKLAEENGTATVEETKSLVIKVK